MNIHFLNFKELRVLWQTYYSNLLIDLLIKVQTSDTEKVYQTYKRKKTKGKSIITIEICMMTQQNIVESDKY